MARRHCDECGAVLDPAKILRCTKCKACFYCSAACQKRNWRRLHKRVCTTDPLLRRFVPVEMAVERALINQPKAQKAPKEATCYICLEGEEEEGKLLRGCACRGDSAGFVHIECLTKLAVSKESGDPQALYNGWTHCGNCKQNFRGALALEIYRRCWRRYRSTKNIMLRHNSSRSLASCLSDNRELDAANQLLDEASKGVDDTGALRDLKLFRACMLSKKGQKLEALGLLQAILPAAKMDTVNPGLYVHALKDIIDVLLHLDRNQEAHGAAAEALAFTKAKFGLEHNLTLRAMSMHAFTCAMVGRMVESKANFKDVLTIQTRVLGHDHTDTQVTWQNMRLCGFAEPSG